MTKLSVNINKIATLRNSRGGNVPDPIQVALDCERFGAQGITVHPRPDERHIRVSDVYALAPKLSTEFNIEGYPSEFFLKLVCEVRPAQVTLVPDPPEVLTSNAGWRVEENKELLQSATSRLKEHGMRVSLFIDPAEVSERAFSLMKRLGVDRIELYTEAYARSFSSSERDAVTALYKKTACAAHEAGLGVNAGHDLNTDNLNFLVSQIPFLAEVSIGHALIADALYWGLDRTIQRYLTCLR
ncbi:MAG: pyridoxine 5'-phosphate synthase [Deltaproteobacteria bacterium]|nr:pyridoxine 5'-phosphate synthase [Deltaproteobacteria bacterium]